MSDLGFTSNILITGLKLILYESKEKSKTDEKIKSQIWIVMFFYPAINTAYRIHLYGNEAQKRKQLTKNLTNEFEK